LPSEIEPSAAIQPVSAECEPLRAMAGNRLRLGPVVAPTHKELLSEYPVARAADADEAHEAVTRTYLPHRFEVLQRDGRVDMQLNAVKLGAITAGYLRFGGEVRLSTHNLHAYHVNVPLAGTSEQRSGSMEPVLTKPGRGAVFGPGQPADVRWGATCAQLCLMIDKNRVERELELQLGRPLGKPLMFSTAMNLRSPAAQSWLAVLDLFEREVGRDGGIVNYPLAAAHLQNLIVAGLLLAQPHNYTDLLTAPARTAPSAAVRRAVEFIEERPQLPWSSASLAQEAAVSVRALQEGFQRSFDLPPMAYLRQVRLSRVHDELVAADPGTVTITTVAARWGFLHAGRFATAYRLKFGCRPSETLRA
jgi:AraC-like DNA-binding protein